MLDKNRNPSTHFPANKYLHYDLSKLLAKYFANYHTISDQKNYRNEATPGQRTKFFENPLESLHWLRQLQGAPLAVLPKVLRA